MSVLKVFEIHTYRDGAWKIDSVFDDRDLAVMEAERIDRSSRYSAVRVVEEVFDDQTEKGVTRTIFRSTKADRVNAATQARRETPVNLAAPRPRPKPQKPRGSIMRQMVIGSFVFAVISLGGLALLYYVNRLAESY